MCKARVKTGGVCLHRLLTNSDSKRLVSGHDFSRAEKPHLST
jgi:hypothetical protein